MISGDDAAAFAAVAFVLIAVPGPSVLFVVGRALALGRGPAIASVVGNALGRLRGGSPRRFGLGSVFLRRFIQGFTLGAVKG